MITISPAESDPARAMRSHGRKGLLLAKKFISIKRPNATMMPKNSVKHQFTLMIVLELHDENERDYVKSPRTVILSQAYDPLFRLIAYRMYEPLVAKTGRLKKKLLETATRMVGPGMIVSILVQQVSHGHSPYISIHDLKKLNLRGPLAGVSSRAWPYHPSAGTFSCLPPVRHSL